MAKKQLLTLLLGFVGVTFLQAAFGGEGEGWRLKICNKIWENIWENLSGWWFGTMEFSDFPFSWEFHHPN